MRAVAICQLVQSSPDAIPPGAAGYWHAAFCGMHPHPAHIGRLAGQSLTLTLSQSGSHAPHVQLQIGCASPLSDES
jgi:hypothetical protein